MGVVGRSWQDSNLRRTGKMRVYFPSRCLQPLSHNSLTAILAGEPRDGLEPSTSFVPGRCSPKLSYRGGQGAAIKGGPLLVCYQVGVFGET